VEIEDCHAEKALDPQVLKEACEKGDQAKLNVNVLENHIDFPKLYAVFALRCLRFPADEVLSLASHCNFINECFHTTLQSHHNKARRKSKIHPSQTSDINEGTTGGQKNVINDFGLCQLKLMAEDVRV
jgi:hypothetical protein